MIAFSTIITPDYLHFALALRESLLKFNSGNNFYILVTGKDDILKEDTEKKYPGLVILFAEDLCKDGIGKKIYDKYFIDFKDEFRWSMKPVLLTYLIEKLNYKKVLCLDCDLFFFNTFDFLLEKLETSNVILTPHWRSSSPYSDSTQFRVLFTHGLFNAGFIGVNNKAMEVLTWWAEVCEFACVKNTKYGYYVDQGFLNALPIYFDKIEIIKHRGCNVAEWNMVECKRTINNKGDILINNEFPIIFIHFATFTIQKIIDGEDPLLRNHLNEFAQMLYKYNNQCDIIKEYEIIKEKRIEERANYQLLLESKNKRSFLSVMSHNLKKVLLNITPPLIVKIYTKLK
ncbi:MAG: hypothetical protein ABIT08_09235 [Bacteroidia bacterium]